MTSDELASRIQAAQKTYPGLRIMQRSWGTRCITLGPWITVPPEYQHYSPTVQYAHLAHECAHVRQYQRCGLGSAWLGIPLFLLLYLLAPLPLGLAWWRYRWEREAFGAEQDARRALGLPLRQNVEALLHGRAYGWAWPKWR